VQETWLAALEQPPRPGPVRGWLATVARRWTLNERRGDERRAQRERSSARAERTEPDPLPLERIELQRLLFELLVDLPEERRTVLYLRYYEGLTPTAIAAHLGVPLKTVKSRHTRALAELRTRLDARSGGDRRAWVSALLPLVIPRGGALAPGATVLGGLVMKKGVLAALVVLAAAAWIGLRGPLRAWRTTPERSRITFLETPPAPSAPELPAAREGQDARREPLGVAAAALLTGGLVVSLAWSDGTPAADIGLEIVCSNDPAPRDEGVRGRTDEQGTARFAALFAGTVRVYPDGRLFPDGYSFREAEVVAGATRELHGTLAEGADVRGRVVDADGVPVPGAEVWGGGNRAWVPDARLLTRCAGDGSFLLRGLEAWKPFGARFPGHLPSPCVEAVDLPLEGDARVVELVLGRAGGGVRGIVLDPEGRPIGDAWVSGGPRGGHTLSLPSGASAVAPEPAAVRTAGDGTFALAGDLEPGTQALYAQARGFPTWRGEVQVVAGVTIPVEIRLERPARIEGRLLDPAGAPVEGVRVRAAEEDRGGWYWDPFPVPEALSDADGWFTLDWRASGARELNASDRKRPALGRARARVECRAGETSTCLLVLDPGPTIAGRVVDAHGGALAGWLVGSETPGLPTWYPRQATTDAEGAFTLYNLGDCAHDLTVRAPGSAGTRTRVEGIPVGTEGLEIVVADADARTGRAHGRLVDASGGRLDALMLVLWREGGREGLFQDFDARSGDFELEALPGRYHLTVSLAQQELALSEPFEIHADETTELGELRIEPSGSLELVVRGLEGARLETLSLSLDRPGCSSVSPELVDGVFRVPSLLPGTWSLSTHAKGVHLPPTVEVASGGPTTVVVDAVPALGLELEVSRADGGTLRALEVEARAPDGALLLRDRRTYLEPVTTRRWQIFLPPGRASIEVRSGSLAGSARTTLESSGETLTIVLQESAEPPAAH